MGDNALIQCNESNIIDIENLIELCVKDYVGVPVTKNKSIFISLVLLFSFALRKLCVSIRIFSKSS